jgi:dolichol-phosphate mannosyltransferase
MITFLKKSFADRMLVIRYAISGAIGVATNLLVFAIATEVLHIWYLAAAVAAFIASLTLTFTLQKCWTFKHATGRNTHLQFATYTTVSVINLGLNIALLYLLVEMFGIWHLAAQFLVLGGLALWSFLINKHFTFERL